MAQTHQRRSVPPEKQGDKQPEMKRFRLNIAEKGDYALEKMKRNGWVESGHQLPDPRHIELVMPADEYEARKAKHRERAARFLHASPGGGAMTSRMTDERTELHVENAEIEIVE